MQNNIDADVARYWNIALEMGFAKRQQGTRHARPAPYK